MLVTARRFKERGAIAGEEIEILEPIDKAARPLSFDEGGLFPEEDMPLLKARRTAKKRQDDRMTTDYIADYALADKLIQCNLCNLWHKCL